jgi:hypothetical protein
VWWCLGAGRILEWYLGARMEDVECYSEKYLEIRYLVSILNRAY